MLISNKNNLKVGKIYSDKDGVNAYWFKGYYNDQLAAFDKCAYSEDKDDYELTGEEVFLNAWEVAKLVEV